MSLFKYLLIFIAVINIVACNSTNGTINNTSNVATITKVQLTNNNTNVAITLKANANIPQWSFGYDQPIVLANIPNLKLSICAGESTNCMPLIYQKESRVESADLSAGGTVLLSPQESYPLTIGSSYLISIESAGGGPPINYSGFPQNFFMIIANNVINLSTEASTYSISNSDYNQDAVNTAIALRLIANYNNSNKNIESLNVIPSPRSYTANESNFTFTSSIIIHNNLNSDNAVATLIKNDLASDLNVTATVDNQTATTGIIIETIQQPTTIESNCEGYQITISKSNITIGALNNTGVFYALQTLRQLWNISNTIGGGVITDYPRFKYRGVMLDVARHFFTVNEVEQLIDILASAKINTLHLHVADDEGLRLVLEESVSSLGNTRGYGLNTTALLFLQQNLDITNYRNLNYPTFATRYSGSYSESDIRGLVSYANSRFITIIPEIDLPGHARALIKSYPTDLVDSADNSSYVTIQGYTGNTVPVCLYNTNESFTNRINTIINQVATQFNSQTTLYSNSNEISLGADEVSSAAWESSHNCSGTMSSLARSQLFFQQISENSASQTLILSGWEQMLESNTPVLSSTPIAANKVGHVWVWQNVGSATDNSVKVLAESGYPVVVDYSDLLYFDLSYSPNINEPGYQWATKFSDTYAALSTTLAITKTVESVASEFRQNVVGIEATLWSENLTSYDHLTYMLLPKLGGLSEASWSDSTITTTNESQVNWQSLATRLGCGKTGYLAYLSKLFNIRYRGYPNGISQELPTTNSICNGSN
jgi:hexosaminidase